MTAYIFNNKLQT